MSEEPPVQANFDQIMSSVADLNKQHITSLYVPSVNDYMNFKPMTVKQQKKIISSSMDTKIQNLTFSNTINDIILENCLESKSKIKLTDKILLLLQLRAKSQGDELIVTGESGQYTINLPKHIENIIKQSNNHQTHEFEIEVENLKVSGSTPNLTRDTHFNKQFTKTVSKYTDNTLGLTDMVGDIYIHEMVKYVDSINIGDLTVMMDNYEVSQTIEVFENLPMSVSTQIAEKIKHLRKIEILSVEHDDLPDDVQIPIDATLFTSG